MGREEWSATGGCLGNCELSIVKGVITGVGVRGSVVVKVGVGTGVLVVVSMGGVWVGMEVEITEVIVGVGADWQAVKTMKLNKSTFNRWLYKVMFIRCPTICRLFTIIIQIPLLPK